MSDNWYAPDAIEIYEPGKGFSFLKDVTVQRNIPPLHPGIGRGNVVEVGFKMPVHR